MAIVIDVSDITVDTVTSTGTIVDGSTYTSPVRASAAVYLKVYKLDLQGNRTDCVTVGNNTGPEDVTQWEFEYDSDGWHQIFYVAIPDFAVASYVLNDVVYRPSNGTVYKAKGATSIAAEGDLDNTANWLVVTDPILLCLTIDTTDVPPNLVTLTSISVSNTVLYPITRENFGTKTGEAFTEATSNYKRSQDVRMYELLGLACDGMNIANSRQEYSLGEIIARRAISLCSAC
jgi:hypothetical protein